MPTTPIADRYEPLTLLGRGGGGVVWRARDQLTGEVVALKVLRGLDAAGQRRLRRELAALRWLRMPGVAQLRDDGPSERDWFIVMDLVEGAPFPGLPTPASWDALRAPTLALLRILARVHAAGVVHRDLKPANVLVRDGQPTLLDFGVSRGRALARGGEAREYTPQFAAPEQLRGEREDQRTDLFALGRMLQLSLDPDRAPAAVKRLLRRLLATRRSRRPASARDALAALSEAPHPPVMQAAAHPEALRPLFVGQDLFQHLREDAAALLFARTSGAPERLREELDRWVEAGLARELDGLYQVDRLGLERLAQLDADRGLSRSLLAGVPARRLLPRVRALAEDHAAAGRHASELAALEMGLALARDAGSGEGPLLAAFTRASLAQESPAAIDRALYTLERADQPDPGLLGLLRGAQAAFRGEGARALAWLDGLAPLPDEALETFRQGHRVRAAARLDREETLLAELADWASGAPARAARLDGWLGNLRYRQNRFEEAAALHLRRAACTAEARRRVSARLDAAMALLEVPDPEAARAIAAEVAAEAAALRHPVYEGYATVYLRIADYRLGRALSPHPELVEAALPLRTHLAALFALTEAAVAWRAGEGALSVRLARQGEALFAGLGHAEPAALCAALAFAAGDAEDPARLLRPDWRVHDLGVQVLALLALGGARDPGWPALARALARARPPAQWKARLDVLSIDEALGALDQKFTML